MTLNFYKYTGLGNDFIILDEELSTKDIIKICDRRFGIGADGVIVNKKIDNMYFMYYVNSDGSLAKMCGNGIRCYRNYLYLQKNIKDENLDILTLSGIKKIQIKEADKLISRVNMGEVKDVKLNNKIYSIDREFTYHYCNTGTEHVLIEVIKEELNKDFVIKYGKDLEKKLKSNINFSVINNEKEVDMITYEKGAGLTLACGTGACATIYLLNKLDKIENRCNINLLGGKLYIELENNEIFMEGISEFVFEGRINL